MSRLIITGATGNAGSGILQAALASSSIAHVTVLSRREPYMKHEKLSTIIIPSEEYPEGFNKCPPALVEKLRGHDSMVWSLGISQMKVSEEEYIKITYDYAVAFAEGLRPLGTPSKPFKFIFVSGEQTDQSEQGRQLFSRIKGRTEKKLKELDGEGYKVLSIRPGGIVPIPEHRPHMSFLERNFYRYAGGATARIAPSHVIGARDLGEACVNLVTSDKGWGKEYRNDQDVLPNTSLQRIVEETKQSRAK